MRLDVWRPCANVRPGRTPSPEGAGCRTASRILIERKAKRTAAPCLTCMLHTVSAVPPSRSDKPMTPGRSSDFQTSSAACLLAETRVVRAHRNGLKRPTSSPGHSGGAVPDSHRSSLFAGRTSVREASHQSRWQSVRVRQGLSNTSTTPAAGRRVSRCEGDPVAILAGCT